MFFFVKQKTAYEMRISDWSSDVCSSDLVTARAQAELATLVQRRLHDRRRRPEELDAVGPAPLDRAQPLARLGRGVDGLQHVVEIGRASCRERVCQYV